MNFLLFTTCDAQGGRLPEVVRLFKSVAESIKQNSGLSFRHYVLLQRCTDLPDEFSEFAVEQRSFLFVPNMISLSRARNIMIKQARKDGTFDQRGLCAFPDDDAWYPEGFLAAVHSLFENHPDLDIFTCRYGSTPANACLPGAETISGLYLSEACGPFIQTASSNTIFLRNELAKRTGFFDERLGVGATINGGEDLDYALRAFSLRDGKVALSREKLVGHRDWTAEFRGKYFSGSLFGIARSAGSSVCLRLQLLRKLMVGLYFLLRGEMSVGQYVAATRIGLGGLGEQRVYINEKVQSQ